MAKFMPGRHLTHSSLDDTISRRAWTNYLSSLDFEHVYFLESDIQTLRKDETELDDLLIKGDLAFAYETFRIFKRRVADRCAYVERLLQRGFDFTKNETYKLRRRDMPWPENRAAWDEVWRKKIKNEYLHQVIGRELAETESRRTNAVSRAQQPDDEAGPPQAPLSPEEFVFKRYKQMLTVLQDSDADWVLQKYLTAFAHAYDPHSGYMTLSAMENFDIEMGLSLVGIGAMLRAEDGAARIVHLVAGGPADRDRSENRLRPGDKIIAVGQPGKEPVDILHRPLYRVVRLIRGKKGTRVLLTVIPASDPSGSSTKIVDLVRDEVKLEAQAVSWSTHTAKDSAGVERKLGSIRLPTFYLNLRSRSVDDPDFRSSSHDVAKAIVELRKERVDGILIDLRNNGGGSLLEAVQMAGLFIRSGPTVMVRERQDLRVIPDSNPTVAYGGPLVVLVNRLSASASEIVAGAMQDYGRAVIVGDSRTHGKGTVQSILRLGLDRKLGSVKVTTASYYRISGSSTQLRGVTPDIVISSPYDFMDMGEDHLPNPIEWSMVQRTRYSPVSDLAAAIEALRQESDVRRAADPRYAAYSELLRRIEVLNESRQVPLNLERRRAMAVAEKELADLQKKLSPRSVVDSDREDENVDVVLDEALKVLAALTQFEEATLQPAIESATNDKKSWPELIEQMLRNL